MSSDQLRVFWAVVGMTATIVGLVGVVVMIWLSRDADRTRWALEHVNQPGLALEKMHARGDFWDSIILTAAVGVLFLVATAEAGAGIAAILAAGPVAIALLVASEVLLLVALLLLVSLGFQKWRRRDKAFSAVRLSKKGDTIAVMEHPAHDHHTHEVT